MKKILVSIIFFYCLQLQGQINTSNAKNFYLDSTGIGIPDGKLIINQIGTAGGRIASEDGRVELIFPAGALTSNTSISIQPITNLFDSSAGKAYRFEPSGIQFKEPVEIIFHYSEEENETCPADMMSFAMQDGIGKWTSIEYNTWDSTTKTLKGYIQHFSGFTNVFNLKLEPADALIKVNDSTNVLVVNRSAVVDTGDFAGTNQIATLNARSQREWFANGVGGGNTFEGKIHDGLNFRTGNTVFLSGTYQAPWFLPKKNPVKVSLAVRYYSKKLRQYVWRSVHCKIGVYDAYRASVIHEHTGRVLMGARIIDSASFLVMIFPRTVLTSKRVFVYDVRNYAPTVLEHGKNGPFKETILVDGVPGSIHITNEIKSEKISSDYPPEIYFEFIPQKILWHKAQYTVAGSTTETVSINQSSLPQEVNFIANGLFQTYNVTTPAGKYKLLVKQYQQ